MESTDAIHSTMAFSKRSVWYSHLEKYLPALRTPFLAKRAVEAGKVWCLFWVPCFSDIICSIFLHQGNQVQ
jgi:hypothetical protein